MANHLVNSISPYLLQHADNPVDWRPWGPEAFAEAGRRQVPVLLSIGYASCHWCHVMAHESFEDDGVARLTNDHFVAIKVDREERPDVDAVYLAAAQALSGQAGWPLTVFTTPDGRPFQAGTYYPPQPRDGLPGFGQLLRAVIRGWDEQREALEASAAEVTDHLVEVSGRAVAAIPLSLGAEDVDRAWERLLPDWDAVNGGFGRAPKFPAAMVLEALLSLADNEAVAADRRAQASDIAAGSLEAMARGGIRDQIGGGFHRYTVDAGWVVPHFEKMLYDNALLLGVYSHAWRASDDAARRTLFGQVVEDVVGWLLREMVTPGGGFAAGLDADSRDPYGELAEGEYYVWNPAQISQIFGDGDRWVCELFRITDPGTFEGYASTLQLPVDPAGLGDPTGARYRAVRERLAEVRSRRAAPARDDKVIASWNGWTISALVRAAATHGRPEWLTAATRAADAVWSTHLVAGRLRRVSRDGRASEAPAMLDDHGALIEAYALLAGATGDQGWIDRAITLVDLVTDHFGADDGGWWDAPDDDEGLLLRPRSPEDNATPSGCASMVAGLRELARVTDEETYDARADRGVRTQGWLMRTAPRFAGTALADTVRRLI